MDVKKQDGYMEGSGCVGSNPLQSAQKKTYLRALKCVAEAGAISCQMLQKRRWAWGCELLVQFRTML